MSTPGSPYPDAPSAPKRPIDTCALLGFLLTFLCPSILPFVLCIVGLGRIRRSGDRGRGLAVAGLVLNSLFFVAIVVGIVIGAVAAMNGAERDGSGRVTDAGHADLSDLRTGDCISEQPSELLMSVDLAPCTSPHWGQVVAVFELSDGPYPGDEETARRAREGCAARVSEAVRARIDAGELGMYSSTPSQGRWRSDRTVNCLVGSEQGPLTDLLPTS